MMPVILNCETCGIEFKVKRYRAKVARYCSNSCRTRTVLHFICVICSEPFTRSKGNETPNTCCCSKKCVGLLARQLSPSKTGPDHYLWKGGKKKDKKKINARARVWNAISSGKIERGSCEVCNESNAEAHHDDYDKPLEVRWLCPQHHRQYHLSTDHPWGKEYDIY